MGIKIASFRDVPMTCKKFSSPSVGGPRPRHWPSNQRSAPRTPGLPVETSTRLAHAAVDQISAVLCGGQPKFLVNPDAWTSTASRRPS
ncbi:MAG: hypothetical protein WKF60_00190 [Ilumatobacter sp.]